MKVWVVLESESSNCRICGVFSEQGEAKAAKERMSAKDQASFPHWPSFFEIVECEVGAER